MYYQGNQEPGFSPLTKFLEFSALKQSLNLQPPMSRREGVPPQGGHALSRPFPMWPRMAEGDAPREKGFSALGLSLSLWKAESSWFSAQASGRSRMLKEAKSPTQAFGMNAAPKGPGVQGTTVHPPQLGVGISFRTRRVCWRSRNSWESCLCGCSVPARSLCLLPVWWGLLDSPCPPTRAYTLPAPPRPSSLRLLSQRAFLMCKERGYTYCGLPTKLSFPGLSHSYSQTSPLQRKLHYLISA